MALDEANALVTALLEEEPDGERRARLVALQLALGYPHALAVQPEHLAELRAHETERAARRWQAQVWLGALSIFAAAWNALGTALWAAYAWVDPPLGVVCAAFAIGLLHAVAGIICARPPDVPARLLRALAWMGLLGPGFSLSAGLGFDGEAFLCGLFCAAPSMLVSLAAYEVSRHTRAR